MSFSLKVESARASVEAGTRIGSVVVLLTTSSHNLFSSNISTSLAFHGAKFPAPSSLSSNLSHVVIFTVEFKSQQGAAHWQKNSLTVWNFSLYKILFFSNKALIPCKFFSFPQPGLNHHFHHCLMPNPIYSQLQIKSYLIYNLWLKHKKNFYNFNEQQLKNIVTHKKLD